MSLFNTERIHCRLVLSGALLSGFLVINSCTVTQCGVLQLQEVAKPGIFVSNNSCTGSGMALESMVYLRADASVRLLSSSDASGVSGHQIICRNQSPFSLKIRVDSASAPWIRPEQDLIRCNDWLNGRLECNELWNNKTALICAISEQENGKLRNTIPRTRSSHSDDDADNINDVGRRVDRQQVDDLLKRDVKPLIEQCRKDFPSDQALTLAWTIKSSGKVTDTAIPENISEDEFVKCAIEVIEGYPFPRFKKDIRVTHEL